MEIGSCGCKYTGLIVDDNQFNLFTLDIMLKSMNIFCETSSSGIDAIQKFINNSKKTCCRKKF